MPPRSSEVSVEVELVPRNKWNGDPHVFPIASIAGSTRGWIQVNGARVMPAGVAQARLQISLPKLNGMASPIWTTYRSGLTVGEGLM